MKQLLIFLLAASAFAGSISNLRVYTDVRGLQATTSAQITIEFTDSADPHSGCTVEISESASYRPLAKDVDPSLFAGAGSCDRPGSIITGAGPWDVIMTLGNNRAAPETDAQPPSFSISSASTSFNSALGLTFATYTATGPFTLAGSETVSIRGASVPAFNGTFKIYQTDGLGANQFMVQCDACAGLSAGGTATRMNNYSQALQANTPHYIRVSHGSSSQAFVASTTNIPNGNTFSDTFDIGPSNLPVIPDFPDTTGATINDPDTGTLLKRMGRNEDGFGGSNIPGMWGGGTQKACGYKPVAGGGFLCDMPTQGGMYRLYRINPADGSSAFLGNMRFAAGPDWDWNFSSAGQGNWDPDDSTVIWTITGSKSGAQILLKTQYTGDLTNKKANPDGTYFVELAATNMTPASSATLTDLFVAWGANQPVPYKASDGFGCGVYGVINLNGHTYAQLSCRSGYQDSPAWLFVLDLGNKLPLGSGGTLKVVAGAPMFASPNIRWCGHHAMDYMGDLPAIHIVPQSLAGYLGGPYTTTLAAGVSSSTQTEWTVAGVPAASGTGIPLSGNPILLPHAAAGDFFTIDGEVIRIAAVRSDTSWSVSRGCHPVGGQSNQAICDGSNVKPAHAAGAVLQAQCSSFYQGVQDIWWNFLADPYMSDGANKTVILDANIAGHQVARSFPNGNNWDIVIPIVRGGPFPDQLGKAATGGVDVSPLFAGTRTSCNGNSCQGYPNYDQAIAPPAELGWALDAKPFQFTAFGDYTIALVPGKKNIYQFQMDPVARFSVYTLPYFAVAGTTTLTDISGVGSSLADAPNFELCVANADDECFDGAVKGGIYASTPPLTQLSCGGREGFDGRSLDLCVQSKGVWMQELAQYSLTDDVAGSRALTKMMGGYRVGLGTTHVLPDASWALTSGRLTTEVLADTFMAKIYPQPVSDGVDRTNYIPVAVPVSPPQDQGITRASINFWYSRYGYEAQQCTQRKEGCNVTASTIQPQPFNFVQTDSWRGQECAESCTITLPLRPGSTMQYQVQYLDDDNAVIGVEPVATVADHLGACDASCQALQAQRRPPLK